MADQLSVFQKLEGMTGIYTAQRSTLRCSAIALRDGGVCVLSPVAGLDADARRSLEGIGDVAWLLAPNHYHNKGLAEWTSEFPDARIVASEKAVPRLHKITGLDIEAVEGLVPNLPARVTILYPQGLKTGELWIRAKQGRGTAWFVADAFCTTEPDPAQPIADTPEILRTFPRYGVADRGVYLAWVNRQIAEDKPTTVVPCHGRVISATDLTGKLHALMERFP